MSDRPIRIVAAAGSVRPGHFTGKALALVAEEVAASDDASIDVVDISGLRLPLPGEEATDDVKALQERFSAATGVVLATPEYHGSYSSVTKLLIDNLGFPSVLSGKPVGLLGVAAGQIGAIKALEHLRSVCSHVGAIVLPGPVSVAGCHKLFDEAGRCIDASTEKRLRGLAANLLDYIRGSICPRVALEEAARSGETQWMKRVTE
ncbi:MAG: NADPH-dependent FMN reductase [Phycisphaeraceae bacterium]|nr:NADPH-dependent FMN reductase [Phycisphaeraceae bacterium]